MNNWMKNISIRIQLVIKKSSSKKIESTSHLPTKLKNVLKSSNQITSECSVLKEWFFIRDTQQSPLLITDFLTIGSWKAMKNKEMQPLHNGQQP